METVSCPAQKKVKTSSSISLSVRATPSWSCDRKRVRTKNSNYLCESDVKHRSARDLALHLKTKPDYRACNNEERQRDSFCACRGNKKILFYALSYFNHTWYKHLSALQTIMPLMSYPESFSAVYNYFLIGSTENIPFKRKSLWSNLQTIGHHKNAKIKTCLCWYCDNHKTHPLLLWFGSGRRGSPLLSPFAFWK